MMNTYVSAKVMAYYSVILGAFLLATMDSMSILSLLWLSLLMVLGIMILKKLKKEDFSEKKIIIALILYHTLFIAMILYAYFILSTLIFAALPFSILFRVLLLLAMNIIPMMLAFNYLRLVTKEEKKIKSDYFPRHTA